MASLNGAFEPSTLPVSISPIYGVGRVNVIVIVPAIYWVDLSKAPISWVVEACSGEYELTCVASFGWLTLPAERGKLIRSGSVVGRRRGIGAGQVFAVWCVLEDSKVWIYTLEREHTVPAGHCKDVALNVSKRVALATNITRAVKIVREHNIAG